MKLCLIALVYVVVLADGTKIRRRTKDPASPRGGAKMKGKKTANKSGVDNIGNELARNFVERTYSPGSEQDSGETTTTMDGNTYEIKYDVSLVDSGVISLAAAMDLVTSVTCDGDGTVGIGTANIILDGGIEADSLTALFPLGSLLVIDSDVFGSCNLGLDIEGPTHTDESTRNQATVADGYLLVDSVSGSSRDLTVVGRPVSFFSLFETGSISIQRLSSEPGPGSSRELAPVNVEVAKEFPFFGIFNVVSKAKVTAEAGLEEFTADWNLSGLTLSLRMASEFKVEVDMELLIKVGLLDITETLDFISFPLFALPRIPYFSDKVLPSLKLGGYFEAPLLLSLKMEIQKEFGLETKAIATTGRKDLVFFIRGGWGGLDWGTEEIFENTPGSLTGSLLSAQEADDSPETLDITLLVGLRPQIVVYLFNIGSAAITVDTGLEVKASTRDPVFIPLPPEMLGTLALFGVCDTCHGTEVDAALKITELKFRAFIMIVIETALFDVEERITFEQGLPGNPTLTIGIGKVCLFREFGEDTIACGDKCCDMGEEETCDLIDETMTPPKGECNGAPSASPTPRAPTPAPITQAPPEPERRPPGKTGTSIGDPHLATFDGLRYDCQGVGEFTLSKSLDSQMEVQGRFSEVGGRFVSLTRGIVAKESNASPVVQVSLAVNPSTEATVVNGCPVELYVDGNPEDLSSGYSQDGVTVALTGSNVLVSFVASGMEVKIKVWSLFGCNFSVNVFLPDSFLEVNRMVGLLGSPNDNPNDDWTTREGEILPFANRASRYAQLAYDFCTGHWCLRNASDSLFTYQGGLSFTDFSRCDDPFGSSIDLSTASSELRELCGVDPVCLIDGIIGGAVAAQSALEAQAEGDMARSTSSRFQFVPPFIPTDVSADIAISVNATVGTENVTGLEGFAIYRVDPETGTQGAAVVMLNDVGSEIGLDAIAGDFIFSNGLALRSATVGEEFAFRAIPIFNGVEDANSPLVLTALNAVRSYSGLSGIAGNVTSGNGTLTLESLDALVLTVTYSWPADISDLDTGTEFLGRSVWFSCGSGTTYLRFSGDNTNLGGSETVNALIGQAWTDGLWSEETRIELHAGWFGAGRNDGPALVTINAESLVDGALVTTPSLSIVIDPGSQSNCATTDVGEVIVVDNGDTVTIELRSI